MVAMRGMVAPSRMGIELGLTSAVVGGVGAVSGPVHSDLILLVS
jgi:hypothetical protein